MEEWEQVLGLLPGGSRGQTTEVVVRVRSTPKLPCLPISPARHVLLVGARLQRGTCRVTNMCIGRGPDGGWLERLKSVARSAKLEFSLPTLDPGTE